MKKLVVVAMSGGVDSSVAAALLKEEGYEVIGVTMCFNISRLNYKKPGCCSLDSIEDARRVARKLGIRHYVLNMQKHLEGQVIKDFCAQYLAGKTPNPCILCNQHLKFGELLKKALALDAQFLATGHYAKVEMHKDTFYLKKANDLHKDQSYFLYRLNQNKLKHILFPLGSYTKNQVRDLARKFALPVAEKPGSQEICFLPKDNYREFLSIRLNKLIKPGLVKDKSGAIIGKHQGIAYYTIGQREGLGIALGYPAYIIRINAKKNEIIVGNREDCLAREFQIKDLHFVDKPIKKKVVLGVKIRYNHKEERAEVIPAANKIKIIFRKPQFAVTPGQAAVFYSRYKIIGGGVIEKVIG
jgi:tRNA-specific 2-thiouridylase